jgi:hypothetical protein
VAYVNFTYPGVLQGRRFHFSQGYGQNCIFVGDILPQALLPFVDGTLTITDGSTTLVIPGCRLDEAHLTRNVHGHFCRIQILGPTWKWRLASIDGVYNVRGTDGNVLAYTQKSTRELATLLFEAMLVPSFDVSGMPDTTGPFVNWRGTNAFEAMTALCHEWGCDFGLDLIGPVARIWKLGVGSGLPSGGRDITQDYGIDIAEPPDRLKLTLGSTLYQSKLKLRAVMEEVDGSLVDIDEVSYIPVGGWTGCDPNDPLGPAADPLHRRLAKKTYLKYFLIESQADGTLNVPGFGEVGSIEDILPVQDVLAEDFLVQEDNYRKSAYIEGVFAIDAGISLRNSPAGERYEAPFRIDKEKGLVVCLTPAYKLDDLLRYVEPELYLVTSYHVRDVNHFQYVNASQTVTLANNGTGDLVLDRPDLIRRVIAEYSGNTVTGTSNNDSTLQPDVDAHLNAAAAEFQTSESMVKTYVGIMPIVLSGTVRQISFFGSVGNDCITMASLNTEWEPGLLRRRQRRLAAESERQRVLRETEDVDRRRAKKRGDW